MKFASHWFKFGCHEKEIMIYYNVNGWIRACYKPTSSLLTTPVNIIACTKLHYNYVEVEFFGVGGGGEGEVAPFHQQKLHFIHIAKVVALPFPST